MLLLLVVVVVVVLVAPGADAQTQSQAGQAVVYSDSGVSGPTPHWVQGLAGPDPTPLGRVWAAHPLTHSSSL